MEFYFERYDNIPGYRPGLFIYDLILKLISIAKLRASGAQIELIVRESKKEFDEIITIVNSTKIPDRDKEGNIIYKKIKGKMVMQGDTIHFQNFSAKLLLENVFNRLLPTFLVFIEEIEKRGYIKDSQKNNFLRIIGDLNQMYKTPKNTDLLQRLEDHLNFEVENAFDREAVLNDADDAIYLCEQLFDRKTNKESVPDKKTYNQTFRVFKKLKEYVLKIQEKEGKITSLTLSQDEDDLTAKENGLMPIQAEQPVIRRLHAQKNQNFELPSFAKVFTKNPETGKYAYTRDVDTRKKEVSDIGKEKGLDTSGLADQRDFFGYTKVFNLVMEKIKEQKDSGALREFSSNDRRDLQNYFAGRKSYVQTQRQEMYGGEPEISWYDRTDPYNESKWFFRKPEGFLLKAICQARVFAVGKRFSYDVDLIYDDFIYLLRTFINGHVKTSGGQEISLEQGATNNSQKIREVVGQYIKQGNIEAKEITSAAGRITKKEAALKRSQELKKKKETGEKALSKKDELDYERKMKSLENELDSVTKGESELLTDIFSLEKMEEDPEFELKEISDIEDFIEDYIRVINIKKTKNLITPKISPKPSTEIEIKNILSRILKRDTKEITAQDISVAKEILAQDSNTFFNRKSFLIDYIQKLKGRIMIPSTIKVTEPLNIPKKQDDKNIKDFLKNVFIAKNYNYNDEEIAAAKNALRTVETPTIDKNYFINVYNALLSEKKAELELDRLEQFKKTEGKELLISDLMSPLSTNKYSNNIYLQMTDLSQEIKFSYKVTDLKMILRPDNVKDNKSSGEFYIYVSRKSLDEFLKLNPYLLDSKNKNPLNNKILILENEELYTSDNIPVIRGTYDVSFDSSSITRGSDEYENIRQGYLRSATSRREFAAAGMTLDKMLDLARLAGAEKNRIKKEILISARKKANQMRRREAILAGKKPKKRITNNFLKTAKTLLEIFENQKKYLNLNTDNVESAIKDYDRIINDDEKIIGPNVRSKAGSEVRNQFLKLYKSAGDQKNELINKNLRIMRKIIVERKLNFLKLELRTDKPPLLKFNDIKYDGSYQSSYSDLSNRFNSLFDKYLNFVFTKPETLVEGLKQIEDASQIFSSLYTVLNELVNLISTPEIEEQYGGRSTRGMRLEKPLDESTQRVMVREVGSKYQKIQILKPTKFSILEQITRRNEIK